MTFSVVQGILELEQGNMIEVGSIRWVAWLTNNKSFRYESNEYAPYTARKEKNDYWYGYRKVSGKLHKRYIGRSVEVNAERLEVAAEALNVASEPRKPKVIQIVTDAVTQRGTDTITEARIAALEARLQLIEERLGKLRA